MCSYNTTQTALSGSAKRESGWIGLTNASIYCACPFHSLLEETINIDLFIKNKPEERVALELSIESAKAFAHAILETIERDGHDH
jgi:hypothetical protein